MKRLLVIIALLFAAPVFAESENPFSGHDGSQPVDISADSLEVLQNSEKALFKGNVIAVQGNITLKADSMIVHYRTDKKKSDNMVSKIEVIGRVHLTTPQESAKGSKGIYDVDGKEIRLLGDVILTREKNVLKGQNLVYDFATGRSVITGGASAEGGEKTGGGRVRGLFIPNQKDKN